MEPPTSRTYQNSFFVSVADVSMIQKIPISAKRNPRASAAREQRRGEPRLCSRVTPESSISHLRRCALSGGARLFDPATYHDGILIHERRVGDALASLKLLGDILLDGLTHELAALGS